MTTSTSGQKTDLRSLLRGSGVWWVTAALFVASWLIQPGSVGRVSIGAMLPFFGVLAIAAAGQTIVVMVRGLDLSVPGMMSLAALVASKFASDHAGDFVLALLVTLVIAVLVGLLNGVITAVLRVTPLIATLATGSALAGASFAYSGGAPARAPAAVAAFSLDATLGVSNTCWVALAVVAVLAVVAGKTVLGRRMAAVGANQDGARLSGIRTRSTVVTAYVVSSLCASVAGVALAGYVKTPNSYLGDAYLLPSIAAVVIGGTSLAGGRGRVVASAVAALFLSQLNALVLATGAPTATQNVTVAVILALAIGAQSLDGGLPALRRVLPWLRTPEPSP